jgi:hypothetical protein
MESGRRARLRQLHDAHAHQDLTRLTRLLQK